MIIDLLGLVIPCLIAGAIIFFFFDIIVFRHVFGVNGRIIAFLLFFLLFFSSSKESLMRKTNQDCKYDKKTSIADEYEKLVKQDQ